MTEKIVMVEVIKPYRDMEKMMIFHPGEKHEVTSRRADELVRCGFVKKEAKTKAEEPGK